MMEFDSSLFFDDDDDLDISTEAFIGVDLSNHGDTSEDNTNDTMLKSPLPIYAIYNNQLSLGDLVTLANNISTENTKLAYISEFENGYSQYGSTYKMLLNDILDTLTEEHLVCIANNDKIRVLISAVYPHDIYVDSMEYLKDNNFQICWKNTLVKKTIHEMYEISKRFSEFITTTYPNSDDAITINSITGVMSKNVDEIVTLESTVNLLEIKNMYMANEAGDQDADIESGLDAIDKVDIDKKNKKTKTKPKKQVDEETDSEDEESNDDSQDSDDADSDKNEESNDVVDIADQTSEELDKDDIDNDSAPDDIMDGEDTDSSSESPDDSGDTSDTTDSSVDSSTNDPIKSIETKAMYRDKFILLYDVISDSITSLEKFSLSYTISISGDFYKIKTNLNNLLSAIYKIVTVKIHKMSVPDVMVAYKISNDAYDLSTRMLEDFINKYKKETENINKASTKKKS